MPGLEDLRAIRLANREAEARAADAPPVECPVCGWAPLDVRASDGALSCPMGHWRWRA